MLIKTDDSQSLSDLALEESPSHNGENKLPKKQSRSKSVYSTLPTLPAIVRQTSQKLSASANTKLRGSAEELQYHTTNKESRDSILSIKFLTLVGYLLLNHERPDSVVNILCPFVGSLPSTTIIIHGEERLEILFSREFMARLIENIGPLGRVELKVA